MNSNLMDLYTDYILSSYGPITATGLARLTKDEVSHDQVTRFLNSDQLSGKQLWSLVKPYVKKYSDESSDGVLIVDDTVIPKPYSRENELNCWHYDHSVGKTIKGINLLTLMFSDSKLNVPVGCELISKQIQYSDIKTRKQKRRSKTTKNELFRGLVEQALKNGVAFKHVLGDCWFGSKDNMEYIESSGKKFVFAQKSNRLASIEIDGMFQQSQALGSLELQEGVVYNALLQGMEKPVHLVKQVFKDGGSVCGTIYLVTNDPELDFSAITALYQRRWKVEEYHKSLKSNLGLGKSPACTVTTQSNHIFLSLLAYVKLETIALKRQTNHFALRSTIYLQALKACYSEIRKTTHELEILPMAA